MCPWPGIRFPVVRWGLGRRRPRGDTGAGPHLCAAGTCCAASEEEGGRFGGAQVGPPLPRWVPSVCRGADMKPQALGLGCRFAGPAGPQLASRLGPGTSLASPRDRFVQILYVLRDGIVPRARVPSPASCPAGLSEARAVYFSSVLTGGLLMWDFVNPFWGDTLVSASVSSVSQRNDGSQVSLALCSILPHR